jgi:hypothetical protein
MNENTDAINAVLTNTLTHLNRILGHRREFTHRDLETPLDHDVDHDAWSAEDAEGNFVGYCYGHSMFNAAAYALDNAIPIHHFRWHRPMDTRD